MDKNYVKVWQNAPKKHQERMVLNYLLSMVEYQLDESPSCDSAFEVVALPLHAGGHVTHGTLGECRLQLMDGKMVIDAVVKLIADQPDALRCNNPNCDWCA